MDILCAPQGLYSGYRLLTHRKDYGRMAHAHEKSLWGVHVIGQCLRLNRGYAVCCLVLCLLVSGAVCLTERCRAQGDSDVTVIFSNGKGRELCRFRAELAMTDEEQMRGLMFRKNLSPDSGMLFVYRDDDTRFFWMKNTYIPLDMVFVGSDRHVKHVHYSAKPLDETPISSEIPVQYVFEIKAGRARTCNIRTDSVIEIERSPR